MTKLSLGLKAVVYLLALLGGVLPIAAYCLLMAGAPAIPPAQALDLRAKAPESVVLVDIRTQALFDKIHVAGAVSWPLSDILARDVKVGIPAQFQGKRLVLYCNSGVSSAEGVRKVRRLGAADTCMVRNGLSGFNVLDRTVLDRAAMEKVFEPGGHVPYRVSPWYEQWALFLTGFIVKPAYMLLSLVLILFLRRQKSADLVALRWGLIFFLAGEVSCMLTYLFFAHDSYLLEFFHSYGMVLAIAFMAYALFEGMDERLIRFSQSEERCAALSWCGSCSKRMGGLCGLVRFFRFLAPAMLVLAFLPLCMKLEMNSYNTKILLTLYNFVHPVFYQMYEIRFCPVMAIAAFAAVWLVLLWLPQRGFLLAKLLFCAGAGALGFSLFRLFVAGVFRDNLVWFHAWEEITEFIWIGGIASFLHIFRKGLLDKHS